MRTLYKYEKSVIDEFVTEAVKELEYKEIGLKRAIVMFAINAAFVIVAAIFLPYIAEHIAELTGLGTTFVGSAFVALTTSLPEVVISDCRSKAWGHRYGDSQYVREQYV